MLLVGSRAMIENGVVLDRIPLDTDYICTYSEYVQWVSQNRSIIRSVGPTGSSHMVAHTTEGIFEFEIAWGEGISTDILLQRWQGVAPLEVCLLLKLSHRYLRNSSHFHKTRNDINMLRGMGVKIDKANKKLLKMRKKETYNYSHPSLAQDKKNFFDDSVGYIWDHDNIHDIVKYGEQPAYTYFKHENEEVLCDMNKFATLPELVKLQAVAEESMVLAIERSLTMHPGVMTPKQAFLFALEKVCTSITSGRFREYAWENFDKVVELYNPEYFNNFQIAVDNGAVKRFTSEY